MNCLAQEKDERTKDSIIKDIRNLFRLKKEMKQLNIICIFEINICIYNKYNIYL